MDFLVLIVRTVLEFCTPSAMRQEAPCPRRDIRRDVPERATSDRREAGFGWMNVASMHESRHVGPASTAVPSMLDNRATRRGS